MPSQYDLIGKRYASMIEMPGDAPTVPSVLGVLPDVTGLNCLDLACGLGRYSRLLVERGAAHVVGIDLSEGMVIGAKETANALPADVRAKMEFRAADCSVPTKFSEGPFDLVFAAWFLNYAADYSSMLSMWQNIYTNLKPGGQFVAIVPNLDLDMDQPLDDRYGITVRSIGKVKDGWQCRLTAYTEPLLEFEMYHLLKEVYVESALAAGLSDIQWHPHILPNDDKNHNGFWDVYDERPHLKILTASRLA